MSRITKKNDQSKLSHRERVLCQADNPPKIQINTTNIPDELKERSRWVLWRWEFNGKKLTKVPYQRDGRSKASTSNPQTWMTFTEAIACHNVDPSLGIGFVFNGDGIIGVDIDDCRDPDTGEIQGWAFEIIDILAGCYTEISPSRTGIKIFGRGKLPEGCRHTFNRPSGGALEIYENGRFFVVTGQATSDSKSVLRRFPKELAQLVQMGQSWLPAKAPSQPSKPAEVLNTNHRDHETALATLRVLDPDSDYELWLSILMACHAVDPSDAMMNEVDAWSQRSAKYVPGEPAKKWETFGSSGSGVGVGTLIHLANQTGKPWQIIEATDDPHRLARLVLSQRGTTANGQQCLVYWRGNWWLWDGVAYKMLTRGETQAMMVPEIKKEFDRVNLIEPSDTGKKRGIATRVTKQLIENVRLNLESILHLPTDLQQPGWLSPPHPSDPKPENCLATQTGIVQFTNVGIQTIPATPRFFTAKSVGYGYDPSKKCPKWLKFLTSLFPDDSESIEALQEWFGYFLLPDASQQKLLLVVGPPRAGKGIITNVLRLLVGFRNVATPTLANLGEQFGLQSLLDKTLAIIPDARLSGRADSVAVVERLLSISGTDPQDIQRKHQETLSGVRLPIRFMITTNELPNLKDAAGAIATRIIVIRLTESFLGREDHDLINQLESELPGILNWSFEGWKRLKQNGKFHQPASGRDLLYDLAELSSPVKQFLNDKCILGPVHSVICFELYRAWQSWCEQNGQEYPGNLQVFGRNLKAALPSVKTDKPNVSGIRKRRYVGVGLLKPGTRGTRSK